MKTYIYVYLIFKTHSRLKCKENRLYDEHIPHKSQKCKGIHSSVQAQIIGIDSLYPADSKNVRGAYLGLVYIFVNFYDEEAQCAFLFMHAF